MAAGEAKIGVGPEAVRSSARVADGRDEPNIRDRLRPAGRQEQTRDVDQEAAVADRRAVGGRIEFAQALEMRLDRR